MEEKRKNKRLDLDVNVQLERLDEDGVTTLKFVHVDVTDISKSGIGFDCKKKLEMNSYYDAKIQIWTKEVVDAVIQIVRSEEKPDGFHYGGPRSCKACRKCLLSSEKRTPLRTLFPFASAAIRSARFVMLFDPGTETSTGIMSAFFTS